jgi:hypothetical protein
MAARLTACILLSSTLAMIIVMVLAGRADAQSDSSPNDGTREIKISDRVPYGREPVDYFGVATNDAVSKLSGRLVSGDAWLIKHDRFGYLLSVLELLDVRIESQLLVYSKTARAPRLVTPKTPRAVFFNDEVSVAWIPNSRELELTAVDSVKGVNTYTLSQPLQPSKKGTKSRIRESDEAVEEASPLFQRRTGCLACHSARSTLEVPGLLLKAFQTDRTGKPIVGYSRMTHDMKYDQRWGGWYVIESPPEIVHRGNLIGKEDNARHKGEPGFASSLSELSQKFEVTGYPYPKSDFVAHLVLAHQVHGTNLLIRVALESRLNRRSDVESQLLRYFVFADEPPLELSSDDARTVLTNSEFASSFSKRGPSDAAGRSLREFSLEDRIFKYRLSYLIYSRLFDELPHDCRSRLLQGLWIGFSAEDDKDGFTHLEQPERAAIIAIVRATVPRLPECWAEDAVTGQ